VHAFKFENRSCLAGQSDVQLTVSPFFSEENCLPIVLAILLCANRMSNFQFGWKSCNLVGKLFQALIMSGH
jgi:hypothetical protein